MLENNQFFSHVSPPHTIFLSVSVKKFKPDETFFSKVLYFKSIIVLVVQIHTYIYQKLTYEIIKVSKKNLIRHLSARCLARQSGRE